MVNSGERVTVVEELPEDIQRDLARARSLHERTASDYEKCVEFNKLMSNILARLEDEGEDRAADRIMSILLQCNPREGCHCDHSTQISQKMKKIG